MIWNRALLSTVKGNLTNLQNVNCFIHTHEKLTAGLALQTSLSVGQFPTECLISGKKDAHTFCHNLQYPFNYCIVTIEHLPWICYWKFCCCEWILSCDTCLSSLSQLTCRMQLTRGSNNSTSYTTQLSGTSKIELPFTTFKDLLHSAS